MRKQRYLAGPPVPSPCPVACVSLGSPTCLTPSCCRPLPDYRPEKPGAPGSAQPDLVRVQAAVSSAAGSLLQQLTCTRAISEQGITYPADVNENILSTVLLCSLK